MTANKTTEDSKSAEKLDETKSNGKLIAKSCNLLQYLFMFLRYLNPIKTGIINTNKNF